MEYKDIKSLLSKVRDLDVSFYTGISGYTDLTSYLEEQKRKYNWNILLVANNDYLKYYKVEFKNIKFI